MQRYFCEQMSDNKFILNNDDSHHIKTVMRMHLGECVEVVYNKVVYVCEIASLDKNVLVLIKEKLDENNEMPLKVTICQSLVNEQKMDFILQKGVELGAYSFIPYKARNSVVKANDKSDKKIVRWQRIIKEASEQAHRNIIPKISEMMDINEVIKQDYDLKIICSVNEMTKSIKKVIQEHIKCDTMIMVIGPEGGFSDEEEKKFIDNGFISVSLGKRVLRTETASLIALSSINYEFLR